ncbi:MAG: phosphoribosylanthranilate isomerase [Gallionellales bacterium CG_4_10_14_3_um_filter_54_96]|nr:phosphoribosylanthranilate isomerase [Gallionella sp.]PIV14740.1 MAG: phosphoribosylanthranilate isomerase [Gallionellales bacterium CG03_land_8_20_14_0_80_55_15]PIV91421.1 MAG: phosphoribosylanthranilate isomerase [Gallionellales bacterium CG17_big_fil_post_rev_8_21_14_2_50_54_146]PIY04222.1 MAG: phosphoribosylanthranilate isomerase [Gallionellales bacterium CG_4_10_14_3_um_filter_54_96]
MDERDVKGVKAQSVEVGAGLSESRILPPASCRVKICGITRAEDALAAARSGADAIGLVFYEQSPRHVTIGQAARLAAVLPPFVSVVGLFVNATAEFVREVLASVRLDVLQFHGDESPEFCGQFNKPYLKAIRVKPGVDLLQCAADFQHAQGLLLDAHVEGIPGGTGARFDWRLIPGDFPLPLILSGGLEVENVAAGIRQVQPYAVDVSSGVEASKGVKDAAKIARFMHEVMRTNYKGLNE